MAIHFVFLVYTIVLVGASQGRASALKVITLSSSITTPLTSKLQMVDQHRPRQRLLNPRIMVFGRWHYPNASPVLFPQSLCTPDDNLDGLICPLYLR